MAFIEKRPLRIGATDEAMKPQMEEASEHGVGMAQPMLRTITIVIGWTAIPSNSIYGLFAPRFLGFQQPQLSATYSVAAILMVTTQLVFPRLFAKTGEHRACSLSILGNAGEAV